MANVSMLEAAKHSSDQLERAVAKIIVENSPVMENLPFMTISGPAYRYNREQSLGNIVFRSVNGSYPADAGVINPMAEFLSIMGGEVILDKFEVDMMSNVIDLKAEKFRMKSRAAGIKFSETFFEGDSALDPNSFDGMRKRLTGTQLISLTTGGATITLAALDQALDRVVGPNSQKTIWCNDTIRRQITSLVRNLSGSGLISTTRDAFGNQVEAYADAPIRIVRREDDGSTILDFDEDDGQSNLDSASIYITRTGMDFIHGIQGMALPAVKDFGELESAPVHMGRLEWYVGLVVKHPRSAVRIRYVNAA